MQVIIVTGLKHMGKTTLVKRFVESTSGIGWHISGILARGLWKNGLREGFDLVDLSDGSSCPLARRMDRPDPDRRIIFDFFEKGLAAGARALSAERCRDADIIIVDEVGKLESVGQGWAPHLRALLALQRPVYIWVVRKDFLEKIRQAFDLQNSMILSIDECDSLEKLQVAVRGSLEHNR